MIDAPRQTEHYYREKAQEIRRFAWRARSAEVRLELFEIAEAFDRMANHVEKRIRPDDGVRFYLERATVHRPSAVIQYPFELGGHP
jgi:hypothetical protein